MTVRAQTLEEWFTDYQLRALARRHFYLPIDLTVDVTRLVDAYGETGARPPLTAIVVKAAALLAAQRPEVNRAVLRTPLGARVVEFDGAHVNVPVAIDCDGRRLLTATVIRDADRMSVDAIRARLRDARARRLEDLPIARRLAGRKNTLPQRALLAARHVAAYSVPSLYARHGGGISVSSLVREAPPGVVARLPSYGPTAFTLCPGPVQKDGARTVLHLGIGYDHVALSGHDAVRCADALGALLAVGDPAQLGPDPSAARPAAAERMTTKTNSRDRARS